MIQDMQEIERILSDRSNVHLAHLFEVQESEKINANVMQPLAHKYPEHQSFFLEYFDMNSSFVDKYREMETSFEEFQNLSHVFSSMPHGYQIRQTMDELETKVKEAGPFLLGQQASIVKEMKAIINRDSISSDVLVTQEHYIDEITRNVFEEKSDYESNLVYHVNFMTSSLSHTKELSRVLTILGAPVPAKIEQIPSGEIFRDFLGEYKKFQQQEINRIYG